MMQRVYAKGKLTFLDVLFIAFCMFPFIIPNPLATTNIQPYAAILGTFVLCREILIRGKVQISRKLSFGVVAWLTLVVAFIVLLISGISISSLRAVIYYYSVAIIPSALCMIMCRVDNYPENIIKISISLWFIVATIQFFVNRSFLTSIISGVRFSYGYRGVVGLASEPSFLGIASFYFLHMITRFRKNQMPFLVLVLIMGIVYAQSMMGVLFIGSFVAVYLLDVINTKKGYYMWAGAFVGIIIFYILLNTVLVETRLYQLFALFMQDGGDGILSDVSAGNRYESLTAAIGDSFGNFLLPLGYTKRIGSGYGGFLCELGFFALPILCYISLVMSYTFKKVLCKVLYFFVITILLFNNTQIGNPLLLVVIATNLYLPSTDGIKRRRI